MTTSITSAAPTFNSRAVSVMLAAMGLLALLIASVGCAATTRPASIPRDADVAPTSRPVATDPVAIETEPATTAANNAGGSSTDTPPPAVETPALDPTPTSQPVVASTEPRHPMVEDGLAQFDAGNLADARVILSQALLEDGLSMADESDAIGALTDISRKLLYSTDADGDCQLVAVLRGDTLSHIAKRTGTTWEAIQKLNGLSNPNAIREGQKLKVLVGTPRLYVWRDKGVLDLWLDDHFVKRYTIALGGAGQTPAGTFTINVKVEDPSWGRYAGGAVDNPIGNRWLGLAENDYGIHGTPVGAELSATRGSIRLSSRDIAELYDIIVIGTVVDVR